MARTRTRKPAGLRPPGGDDVDPTTDAMVVRPAFKDLQAAGLEGLMTSQEAEDRILGLPFPAIALCLLFGQDVLVLGGRNLMITGPPGSCKSAFLAEISRWFLLNMGVVFYVENENKDAPELRNGVCGRDPALLAHLHPYASVSPDDWMHFMDATFRVLEKLYAPPEVRAAAKAKANRARGGQRAFDDYDPTADLVDDDDAEPGVGYVAPVLFGLDSVTATSPDDTFRRDQQRNAGVPQREYSFLAYQLSAWAKHLPRYMANRPYLFAGIYHNKRRPNKQNPVIVDDNVAGGDAMRFMDTTEVRMLPAGKVEKVNYAGVTIKMRTLKQSLAPSASEVEVLFKWWYEPDPETGRPVQQFAWDWDAATTKALLAQKAKGKAHWEAVNGVVDLHEVAGKRVWSQALDIAKSDAVDYHTFGRTLHARWDLVDPLLNVLRVKRLTPFTPGLCFRQAAQHKARGRARNLCMYRRRDLADTMHIDAAVSQSRTAAQRNAEAPAAADPKENGDG